MLDLEQVKTPSAKDGHGSPVQCKYTLSSGARDKLRRASEHTGQDMSTILEMLIRQELPDPNTAEPSEENAHAIPIEY